MQSAKLELYQRGFGVSKPTNISELIYSPEFVARLLHRFISGSLKVEQKGIKYELIYWVLPIVMNDDIRILLNNVNVSSSFDNVFYKKGSRGELVFIDDFILNSKDVTNKGLIYLNSITDVVVDEYLSVKELVDFKSDSKIVNEYFRAAYYLGVMLAKEDYRNLYLKFGVTSI